MADNFGLKIGLEGEKEFKKALSDINSSFKVLGSEMKLVSSQFDKNDNSVQALTARNTVLNKEIEAQRQKIETLRAALQNAAESFGENDRRTQNWQIQLNNAEAALNGMERELDDNNKALEEAENGLDDAGKEADEFGNEIKDAGKQSDDAGSKLSKLGDVAKKVGQGYGRRDGCHRNRRHSRRQAAVGHGEPDRRRRRRDRKEQPEGRSFLRKLSEVGLRHGSSPALRCRAAPRV